MNRHLITTCVLLAASAALHAQQVVSVGKGSYASYTPLELCYSDDHTPDAYGFKGDKSRDMQYRKIYLTEREGQPIPTNDWWTNLITEQYSGHLWSYPQMIQAQKEGVDIQHPSFWIADGTEMKSNTVLTVGGVKFKPESAVAESWHDWDVAFSMKSGARQMYVTMAHGMPFTWIETKGLQATLQLQKSGWTDDGYTDTATAVYDSSHRALTGTATADRLLLERGGDLYGVYLPEGSAIEIGGKGLTVTFPPSAVGSNGGGTEADGYVVVAVLDDASQLDAFAPYALCVPRSTRVDWQYVATEGRMHTTWHVDADNLATGRKAADVLMGFLPHQWRDTGFDTTLPFTGSEFATPHGRLKLAAGNDFAVDYRFYGMLPYWAAPSAADSEAHPYSEERMTEMLARYADTGTFGTDTYWGGKGLTQMALYMMMAREMGRTDLFEKCRSRLKEAMVNWLTYTPGEKNCFFARYDRWGAMVGYSTSYDSDTFNDHHFHYGYFTLAGALLALVDDDFRTGYGQMLRLLAKDYANWQRTDTRFPLFRTFDPWAGHSFAGGMGDGNGNGQESSSEAMQSWGGLYLLGVALGDDEMRDAGIFGWLSEARGTAEYWFDRHRDNIDYTKFLHPYNSNLTCHGVGWWTYFGYQNLYMQGIQWMPTSTALDYLSEDKAFAKWDYEQLFTDPGKTEDRDASNGNWFEDRDNALDRSGDWGNVTLSYLQRSDPEEAARLFDVLWDKENDIARTSSTNGITYFSTHSHLTNGDLDWTVTADLPTARVYRKADGTAIHMAYNPYDADRTVTFSDGFQLLATARQLTVEGRDPRTATDIATEPAAVDIRESLLMPNLALHKPCTASGYENVGTVVENATDGDDTSRWGSLHKDGEWIVVDLQQPAALYKLRIHWEAAYASLYTVELSADGENWTYSQDVTSAGGWDDVLLGDRTARYVRITGKKRATQYGISLYEIQAFGRAADAADTDIQGIRITADCDVLKQNAPSQLSVKGYTNGGEWVDTEAAFGTSDGTVTATGVFTPSVYGTARVQVTLPTGSDIYEQAFPVEEALYVRNVTVSPSAVTMLADGTPQPIDIVTTDQFGCPIEAADGDMEYELSDPLAGHYDPSTRSLVITQPGTYTLTVRAGLYSATVSVTARRFEDMNLALGKTATASSQNGDGSGPDKAVDGDATGTRWESRWQSDDEWIAVDLDGLYNINKVVVYWENARATSYWLQTSTDGEEWQTVQTVSDSPTGGETITFTPTEARYVRIQGLGRNMEAYGYSIYELEVYGLNAVSAIGGVSDNAPSADTVYDLGGRSLGRHADLKSLPKGLYIVGRKKVAVR